MTVHWKISNFDGDDPDVGEFFSGMDLDLHCLVTDVGKIEDGDWAVSVEILDMEPNQ